MVNTFLIGSYEYTAVSLDHSRLLKQAVEAKQVIMIIEFKKNNPKSLKQIGFQNHPLVKMWFPYLDSLKLYYNTILSRLFLLKKFNIQKLQYYDIPDESEIEKPWFLNYEPLIYSHRARLYQKNPKFYSFLEFPDEYLDIGYIWVGRYEKEYYLNEIDIENYEDLIHISDPLHERYINPRYCPAIKKDGKVCGHMIKTKKDDIIYCGIHKKMNK
jgi:hypothetical protein